MNEQQYEKILNIKTMGVQKWDSKSTHYSPYEPTSYAALEILFEKYQVDSTDHVVDFGCGKGRLIFYIHHFCHASVTGIEMNQNYYRDCCDNLNRYRKLHGIDTDKINFVCCLAQDYSIQPLDNKFYFFNPFSLPLFIKIIQKILVSVQESMRSVELILYYPSADYIYYLENSTCFKLTQEIIRSDIYKRDSHEIFLIYQLLT